MLIYQMFHLITIKSIILTVCVTCVWAGVDSVWEQEKLEARKMLENAANPKRPAVRTESEARQCARFVVGRRSVDSNTYISPFF